MTAAQIAAVAGSGVFAGTINAVAGGGSFLTLPVLIACGLPPVSANATSTIAIWPGTFASLGAYRRELDAQRHLAVSMSVVSLLGGAVGALILLHTPDLVFTRVLPWLTLFATVVFIYGPRLATQLKLSVEEPANRRSRWQTSVAQFIIAVYGGYYGAGAGIMMLAMLAIVGMKNIHAMNAFKSLLTIVFNGSAVVLFIVQGIVHWPAAGWMMGGAIAGGYGGAWLARQLPPSWIRTFVILVGVGSTGYFFYRALWP